MRTLESPRGTARLGSRLPMKLGVVGLASAALAGHAAVYWPFIADDSLISLRYAERLVAGQGLTWTAGERVEGYSNLLWILLCATLQMGGVAPIDAARLLGVTCTIGMFAALLHVFPPATFRGALASLVAGFALAATGPIAVWAIGGLEQPLFAMLLAWSLVLVAPALGDGGVPKRSALGAGVALAGLCLTRPDGPIFVATICGSVAILRRGTRPSLRDAALIAALPAAAVCGQLVFRLAYYGDWIPNTAHVKAHLTAQRLQEGLAYHWRAAQSLWPLGMLAASGLVAGAAGHRRRESVVYLLCLTAWLAYVASVGGDIFPAYRHWVPAVVVLAFLCANGIDWLARGPRPRVTATWASATGLLALLLQLQMADPENLRATTERWEWDGEVIGTLFRTGFGEQQPLYAVTAAGTLPYFSKLPSLDMLGLNDRHIARAPPTPNTLLGHDRGDGAYVLDRAPDLVTFGPPSGLSPTFVSGQQMRKDPRFRLDYRRVTFVGYEPYRVETRTYVRRWGRVGITASAQGVRVPGYLLEPEAGAAAPTGQLDAEQQMAGLLAPSGRFTTGALDLKPGTYRIAFEPAPLELGLFVTNVGPATLVIEGDHVIAAHHVQVTVTVTTPAHDTLLRAVRIEPDERADLKPSRREIPPGQTFALPASPER